MMRIFHRTSALLACLLLILVPPAFGQSTQIQEFRAMQDRIDLERRMLRERADALEEQVATGRTMFVYLPLDGIDAWHLTTEKEALGTWTTEYLVRIMREGTPFSSDGLADFIKARRDAGRDVAANLTRTAELLRARAEWLDGEWARVETLIAEVMEPESVPEIGIARTKEIPRAECIYLSAVVTGDNTLSGSGTSYSDAGNIGTYELELTMTWTPPPARLCDGDSFEITMTVTNAGDSDSKIPRNYVAKVALSDYGPGIELGTCTQPATWTDPTGYDEARLLPDQNSYTNTCTINVTDVVLPYGEPETAIRIGATSGITQGSANALYKYSHP